MLRIMSATEIHGNLGKNLDGYNYLNKIYALKNTTITAWNRSEIELIEKKRCYNLR